MINHYKELVERCNGKFVPQSLDDFIGVSPCGARTIAGLLTKAVHLARLADNAPAKFLLNGRPGLGKSALALYLQRLLGCKDKWSVERFNGTEMKVEVVQELAKKFHYRNLFGDYRVVIIDEADHIPTIAQVRFLTLLDELPNDAAIICTSNCKLKDFEERFQTRFQAFDIEPPAADEIETLLRKFVGNDPCVRQIATLACGNVRQALLDVQGAVQASIEMPIAA